MRDEKLNVRRATQKETQTVSHDNFVQAILAEITPTNHALRNKRLA